VIIRAKNEAAAIGEVIDLVLAQELNGREAEVIVVDSGSSDGTLDLVRARPVQLIEIPSATFSFGGALNTGCSAASAPVLVALSAHAFPRDERWLARVLACFDDERVACACGVDNAPDGSQLNGPVVQDLEHWRGHPTWGYSNAAGAFRAELWNQRPFREDMPGTEDKEWAAHWLERGYVVVVDPSLRVRHDHSHDPLHDIYRRFRVQWTGHTMFRDMPRYGARELAREWWHERNGWPSHLRARLSPQRIARLLGKYAGTKATRS
jgi:glycosyltransferase involved in cell wall biosynthesis